MDDRTQKFIKNDQFSKLKDILDEIPANKPKRVEEYGIPSKSKQLLDSISRKKA